MRSRLIEVRELQRVSVPTRSYGTHKWDRYPAKMVPHLARHAIMSVSKEGDVVLDPFCGCGTVQVECTVLGRHSVGIDINPVAVHLAKTKCFTFDPVILRTQCKRILRRASSYKTARHEHPKWIRYWFSDGSLDKLVSIRDAIERNRNCPQLYKDLLRTALIACARLCSRADPRSPKPFISRTARNTRVGRHFNSFRLFSSTVEKMIGAYASMVRADASVTQHTVIGDARCFSGLVEQKVNAIVTSPPYLSAQDYFRSSKLELFIGGFGDKMQPLGVAMLGSGRGRVEVNTGTRFSRFSAISRLQRRDPRAAAIVCSYLVDMETVCREMYNALKRSGKCCLIVGDSTIRGVRLPVHRWLKILARRVGFKVVGHEVDQIRDRRIPPKRTGHQSVIACEHLLYLAKG
jgi:DNA modification methylase